MNPESWGELLSLLAAATAETLYMVGLSGLLSVGIGLPLGVALFIIAPGGAASRPRLHAVLGGIVNAGRSLPFVVLLIAVIPLTRLIVGTSLGSSAAVVPLTLGAIPFFARIVEAALREVDPGRVEAVVSMGGTLRHVILMVLLPEALPALVAGVTLTAVVLVSFSAMAGVVGGGGLGDLAIRYGYQRFNTQVMVATVVVLVGLVQGLQSAGDWLARRVAHKR
ncbi:methionine ABC transporter permease [Nitrospirillum sp. BR 11163]|uniref:methionine ABC transporter permease n=1 Tax=Nitrospirillum sp. BR 11163 TaxID=3104323 RepID=UPI002B001633|nr:methionine ABC transporter permease [Nitrospirillum sp. BR 11163]MEA1674661.1 methionine ABC transporter permease [Nitrospirillum sp. BR 11163]